MMVDMQLLCILGGAGNQHFDTKNSLSYFRIVVLGFARCDTVPVNAVRTVHACSRADAGAVACFVWYGTYCCLLYASSASELAGCDDAYEHEPVSIPLCNVCIVQYVLFTYLSVKQVCMSRIM